MKKELSTNEFIKIVLAICDNVEKEKDYLSELDRATGDGDHGVTMSIGWNAVKEKIKETSNNTDNIIEILEKGSHTANESMLLTKEMLSKKGRSSKLGERSKGHIDPGAASSALIFRTFHEAAQKI